MALPIIEKIATELVTRLEAITTANSYEFDVESVTRPRRLNRDFTPRNYSIVVDQEEETYLEELSYPGTPPAAAYDASFGIYGFVRESDDASTSPAITENQMGAAIRKAIANGSQWHTFDDNSIDAEFGSVEPFDESQTLPFVNTNHNGVKVTLVVRYRVSELDPYVLRT